MEGIIILMLAIAIGVVIALRLIKSKLNERIAKHKAQEIAKQWAANAANRAPRTAAAPIKPKPTQTPESAIYAPILSEYAEKHKAKTQDDKPARQAAYEISPHHHVASNPPATEQKTNTYSSFRERTFKHPPTLYIHFTDRDGQQTQRTISVKSYSWANNPDDGSIWAFCHLRNAQHPFAFKQISKAVDTQTGEIIADLPHHLEQQFAQTTAYAIEQLLEEYACDAYILFCFARLDGAIRANEREIIEDYFVKHSLNNEALEDLTKEMRLWSLGSAQSFYEAVREARAAERTKVTLQELTDACVSIVGLHRNKTDTELRWLTNASKEWGTTIPAELKYKRPSTKKN